MEKAMQPKKSEMASLLSPPKHGYPAYCDNCDDEKLQWQCAADEAYWRNGCDASVHGAKSLSLKHERATLDCNESVQKVPDYASLDDQMTHSKSEHGSSNDSDSCCWNAGSLQKPKDRSIAQCHPAPASQNYSFSKVCGITYTRATKVKLELDSHFQDQHGLCELSFGYNNWRESENYSSSHEVPVLVPVAQTMPSATLVEESRHACSSSLATPSEDASPRDFMGFLVPEYCDVDEYLVSNIDLISKEELKVSDVASEEVITGDEKVEGKMYCESKTDESRLEFPFMNESQRSIFYDYEGQYSDQSTDGFRLKYSNMNILKQSGKPKANCMETNFVPLRWVCEKLKVERAGETDQINQQLEAMIEGPIHSINQKNSCYQKSFLSLNYEEVLSAWSDRGCFWTGSQWPKTVPSDFTSDSMDEASLEVGDLNPDVDPRSVRIVVQKEEAPVFATTQTDGGREARVLRYREKRRTRLFSKKIRYEVRKRNAEGRPRIKGRFVKWSVDVLRA